jgi:D-alanyl-D-alanine carboxypeptidase
MGLLRATVGRGSLLALATLLATSCSTPPFRDFAAAGTPGSVQQASPIDLINGRGETPDNLGAVLTPIRDRAHIPGLAAVVLRGDQIIAQGAVGVRRNGSDSAVTINDQFEIASCAKAMSAMVVARLVEDGTLAWDEPLTRYFPHDELHPDWEKVTLRHLLTHTAGLRDPLVTFLKSTVVDHGSLAERRLAFVRRVLREKPHSAPGTEVHYCNIDYILAGAIAEQATGKSWEQLMALHVFAPLGIRTAGFGPPGMPNETVQPWGHGKVRVMQVGIAGNVAFDPGADTADYPAIASPVGYVHLSILDWAKFVSLQLRAHSANPNRNVAFLRTETFDTLHAMRPNVAYSGGWWVGTRPWAKGTRSVDTGRVLFHLGNNGRWTSAAWVAPEIDLAVLVTCNRGDMDAAIDEVCGKLTGIYAHRAVAAAR